MTAVMIGVDPHKGSHTATALDATEHELACLRVRAGRRQVEQLLAWATPFEARTWAIESANGLGYLLAQQLLAAGEVVLDVPATLAARVRVLSSGQSNKNDPNDARSVAIAAMHAPMLAAVPVEDHRTVLRLMAKNHTDLARWRNKICCRLHALVAELVAGGISKEVVVSDAFALLESIHPEGVAAIERHRLAGQLADELVHVDDQLKLAKANIRTAVAASGTTLTDIFGVGPVVAAMLIGYTGEPFRFPTSGHYAAYTGTAPDRVLLGRARRAPPVAAREPAAQPRAAHCRGHPDPSRPQPRPCLLRPQARRRQDTTRSAALLETAAVRHRVASARRRRPPCRR